MMIIFDLDEMELEKLHMESLISPYQDDGFGNEIRAPKETDEFASIFIGEKAH